jgi:hypothetical protein
VADASMTGSQGLTLNNCGPISGTDGVSPNASEGVSTFVRSVC